MSLMCIQILSAHKNNSYTVPTNENEFQKLGKILDFLRCRTAQKLKNKWNGKLIQKVLGQKYPLFGFKLKNLYNILDMRF